MCTSRDLIKVRLKGDSLDINVYCFKYVLKDINYALVLYLVEHVIHVPGITENYLS